MTMRKSQAPPGIIGLWTSVPKRTSLCTEPPRWLMPWTSAFLTSQPLRNATSAKMSEALMTPVPPRPAKRTLRVVGWVDFMSGSPWD
ncbi:MAG: hypothetical protein BWX86_02797 [Verrucomicrobia bacterium ADurb.Bin122]|nr:MAG: hypothetical protein BWX86_02797 [Verrucomicrobia bacterium ADurb.Bin122]